jgi:hypothetical protein
MVHLKDSLAATSDPEMILKKAARGWVQAGI